MSSILKPFAGIARPAIYAVPSGKLQVDWTHNLASGLIGCFLPGPMGPIDVAGNITLNYETSYANEDSVEGIGLKSSATSSGMNFTVGTSTKWTGWTAFTLVLRAYVLGNTSDVNANFFGISYTNTDSSPFVIAALQRDGTASQNFSGAWNDAGSFSSLGGFPIGYGNGINTFGLTLQGGGGAVSQYLNGVAGHAGFTFTGPPNATANSAICLGGWVPVNTRSSNMISLLAAAWTRALTADEMKQIHYDPYSFIIPAEYDSPVVFLPAAATFNPGWARGQRFINQGIGS